ncbi:hypothetical protein [Streptomyces sp. enrichment culture]|uniref:hypothetical protein n=1 Tax=Streptomyces sp. enrichment culture TaxID=1795815 RepID=UPI003F54E7AC
MSVGHTEATGGAAPGGPGRTGGRGVRGAADRSGGTPNGQPRPRRARDDRRQP